MKEQPKSRVDKKLERQEKVKEAIHSLESLDLFNQDKVMILLTYAGLKPISQFGWKVYEDKGRFAESNEKSLHLEKQLSEVAKNLGLAFSIEKSAGSLNPSLGPYEDYDMSFAKNPTLLKQFTTFMKKYDQEHENDSDHSDYYRQYGSYVGFPKTAVEGFVQGTLLDKLPQEVKDTPLGKFTENAVAMRFSKDHWQEELALIKTWMDAVEKLSPAIFESCMTEEPGGGSF